MMTRSLTALLAMLAMTCSARGALPATPLEPVYHALFSQQNGQAWQQLINLWPQMSSAAQRDAWRQALDAVVSRQCGNDLPIAAPLWLDHPTLVLIQRDIPLNRIYRVQFSGKSLRHNLQISLTLPNGEEAMSGANAEYDQDQQFRLQSQERGEPFPAGIYRLTVRSGSEIWQQTLALQGLGGLNWVQRQGQKITFQPPTSPATCPLVWLEQTLLRRSDFQQIWWQRSDNLQLKPWPQRADADAIWANMSVIRVEARGGLTLRLEHRLAGPLLTLKN
jgi:hypothetical protein